MNHFQSSELWRSYPKYQIGNLSSNRLLNSTEVVADTNIRISLIKVVVRFLDEDRLIIILIVVLDEIFELIL